MAAAVTITEKVSLGGTDNLYLGTIAMDSSYPTGGEVLDATTATPLPGPTKFKFLTVAQSGGYVAEFIPSSQKLKFYRQKNPADAGGADIPLPEVANAVDLSGLTAIPFMAIGA